MNRAMDKYRINPDFVVPEPTAATFFAMLTEEQYSFEAASDIFADWKQKGVKQSRLTIINDEYPHEPYPHGYWLEGWTDENARMLPFGEAEHEGGPIWPPLTYGNGKLASGMDAGREQPVRRDALDDADDDDLQAWLESK
jgi:hypothetical protein